MTLKDIILPLADYYAHNYYFNTAKDSDNVEREALLGALDTADQKVEVIKLGRDIAREYHQEAVLERDALKAENAKLRSALNNCDGALMNCNVVIKDGPIIGFKKTVIECNKIALDAARAALGTP